MKNTQMLINEFESNTYKELLTDIYVDESRIDAQTKRYINALKTFEKHFGEQSVEIYSAPGRSEIGGNHTDHQHGKVLAASINNDAIAITRKTDDNLVKIISGDSNMITVDTNALDKDDAENGTTLSLIKGVLAGIKERGYTIGGFESYITSDVLIGAGLSSSAAFETVIGTIISGLYNNMAISSTEIAIIGQFAENVYFGKPCGLMDQMASSTGGLVYIDFANPAEPIVEKIDFDLSSKGYSLCITDTKGSHANLTPDYAAIPEEMKKVATFFGKEVLRGVTLSDIYANISQLREKTSDRAVLRAIHFVEENNRVDQEVNALKNEDLPAFLNTVKASGDSSYKYLQNVYTNHDVDHQAMSIALAASDTKLGFHGVSRVHGGGFAGTIQAFVENSFVNEYKELMDSIFGTNACDVLKIRKYGGMKVL